MKKVCSKCGKTSTAKRQRRCKRTVPDAMGRQYYCWGSLVPVPKEPKPKRPKPNRYEVRLARAQKKLAALEQRERDAVREIGEVWLERPKWIAVARRATKKLREQTMDATKRRAISLGGELR